jgi:hypothetical protein
VKRDGTAYENPNLNGGSMLTVSMSICGGGALLIRSGSTIPTQLDLGNHSISSYQAIPTTMS